MKYINQLKELIERIKNIKTYGINYDFIKSKELEDKYINYNKDIPELDKIIDEEILEECEEEDKEGLEKELIGDNNKDNENNNYKEIIEKEEDTYEEENIKEKLIIDKTFIDYQKKYNYDKSVWWPIKLVYGGKKYYAASHSSYLKNKKYDTLYYYCVNHKHNTPNKKIIFNNKPCNGKIEYNRKNNEFYMIIEHNKICNNKFKKIYDNLANIEEAINKFGDFKKDLISILNSNPLMSYYYFKKIEINKFLKNMISI